ncbi:WhiB family transcriptional regulator [Mycobacterium parmense]|nr:WhiB family transcriptional regulator [Mycobacterium parmense]MCV7353254.1 WhiB family transcriptional regulator [Mycobacterium parmense]
MSGHRPTVGRDQQSGPRHVLRSAPAPEHNSWAAEALCRTTDPDNLFVQGADQRKAAAICRRCPVVAECGAEALDNRVEYGVWGGMTERERRAVLKKHPEVVSWSRFLDERKSRLVG